MKYDNHHFNINVIGPKKRTLGKMIDTAKAACRLAMTEDNSKALQEWAGRWRQAVCYLQVINAIDVFARRQDDFSEIHAHCLGRTSLGTNEFREAYGFVGRALETYGDEFLGKRKAATDEH